MRLISCFGDCLDLYFVAVVKYVVLAALWIDVLLNALLSLMPASLL